MLLFAGLEYIWLPDQDVFSLIFSIAYFLFLCAIPFFPLPASFFIVGLGIAADAIPIQINAPSFYWGSWFSLGYIAIHLSLGIALFPALVSAVTAFINNLNDYSNSASGSMVLALTYIAAFFIGRSIRLRNAYENIKREEQLRAQDMKHAEEMVLLLHQLHDLVAGKLTYGIIICRLVKNNRSQFGYQITDIQKIEDIVSEALQLLREDVITPSQKYLSEIDHGQGQIPQPARFKRKQKSCNSEQSNGDNSVDLNTQLNGITAELNSLDFDGEAILQGDIKKMDSEKCLLIKDAVNELSNNILKHGVRGTFVMSIDISTSKGINILSSNKYIDTCDNDRHGIGLALLKTSVIKSGGEFQINAENGDWTIYIHLPLAN